MLQVKPYLEIEIFPKIFRLCLKQLILTPFSNWYQTSFKYFYDEHQWLPELSFYHIFSNGQVR